MKQNTPRPRTRTQQGFTLIELLVVLAILGILAGVVVFAVSGPSDLRQQCLDRGGQYYQPDYGVRGGCIYTRAVPGGFGS